MYDIEHLNVQSPVYWGKCTIFLNLQTPIRCHERKNLGTLGLSFKVLYPLGVYILQQYVMKTIPFHCHISRKCSRLIWLNQYCKFFLQLNKEMNTNIILWWHCFPENKMLSCSLSLIAFIFPKDNNIWWQWVSIMLETKNLFIYLMGMSVLIWENNVF